MQREYRGEVAFGVDTEDVFWTNDYCFRSFAESCINQNLDDGDDLYTIDENSKFDFADSRDSAGSYGKMDSVMDFVTDRWEDYFADDYFNTEIIDAYVDERTSELIVIFESSKQDLLKFEKDEPVFYETMILEKIDHVKNNAWVVTYLISNFNVDDIAKLL